MNSTDSEGLLFSEKADIETASEEYASRFSGEAGRYFLQVQAQMTLALLRDLPGASILDVGGGHAQLTMPLARSGYRVTVTGSANSCRERLDKYCQKDSFKYITCDCLHLPFKDRQFDVVMSFRLLPHTEYWRELIAEMCRVAGKCIIFDYPDRRSANILYNLLFEMKKNMEGNTRTFALFSRKEISRALRSNGYDAPMFRPEFLAPMVIHRKVNNGKISRGMEAITRITGLTHLFGSPVIVRSNRRNLV